MIRRRFEHHARDQRGGFARFRIECERAAGGANRFSAARDIATDERGLRGCELDDGECTAELDVAIAVEVALDAIGELACGRATARLG